MDVWMDWIGLDGWLVGKRSKSLKVKKSLCARIRIRTVATTQQIAGNDSFLAFSSDDSHGQKPSCWSALRQAKPQVMWVKYTYLTTIPN